MEQGVTFFDLTFKCPYCGHNNTWRQHVAPVGKTHEFVYCDIESGGCEKKMVIENRVTAQITLKPYKIPSEGKKMIKTETAQ